MMIARAAAVIGLCLAVTTVAIAQLAPRGEYNGIVRSENGSPIEGAVVTVMTRTLRHAVAQSARTDSEGRFHFARLTWPAEVTISAPGHSVGLLRISDAQDLRSGEITLKRAAIVEGIVVDGDGLPAAGVIVDILYDGSKFPLVPAVDFHGGRRTSGQDGRFRVTNVSAQVPFLIETVSNGVIVGRFGPFREVSGTAREIALRLPPLKKLEGVVEDDLARGRK